MELRLPPIRDLHLSQPPAPPRDEHLAKVYAKSQTLCAFAEHYASGTLQPEESELAAMADCAAEVIDALEEYRRLRYPPPAPAIPAPTPAPVSATTPRPPKRPWEDAAEEQSTRRVTSSPPAERHSPAVSSPSPAPRLPPSQEAHMHVFDGLPERLIPMDDAQQAAADRDMEDIRARRAAGQGGFQGKVKYKKRSRASPAGPCHSCEIVETPEWRRGPDGQRTLCNACGLHYAKLVRKRDRIISTLPAGGQVPPPIDITYLRKSARLAAENSAIARSVGRRRVSDDKDKPTRPDSSSSKRSASEIDSEPVRGNGSGRRGWGRREGEADELMLSPIHSSFPRGQATSPYPPSAHMSPAHLTSPIHASPVQPMTLPPPNMTLPPPPPSMHGHTLPSMRSSYPPPMGYAPGPYPSAYGQPPAPSYGPPMQPGYGPPPHGYAPMPQQGPMMGGPLPPQSHPPQWDRYSAHGRDPRS